VLQLFVAGMATVLVAFAVNMQGTTSKGAIGLAMVNVISFNVSLAMLIDMWTQLETSLGAIARLKMFMKNTPKEDRALEKQKPPSDWPARGAIEIKNITASYR
jgi:ABC-type bacteriocin/lantibiotic exporter with double-glycine peptidase domain